MVRDDGRRWMGLGLVLCLGGSAGCRTPADRLAADVAEIATEAGLHGWIHVEQHGNVLLSASLGAADPPPVVTATTPIHLASLSKLLTEVLALRLTDAGLLPVSATLHEVRPTFQPTFGRRVTIDQLLAMRAGLPREWPGRDPLSFSPLDPTGRAGPALDTMPDVALAAEPGTATAYSNLGYWLVGAAIEAVTGSTLDQALDDWVLRPLGMASTGYRTPPVDPIAGLDPVGGALEPVRADFAGRYASGGFVSTVEDLRRLAAALLREDFLLAASRARLFGPADSARRVEVVGALPGHAHMLLVDREQELIAIALNNVSPADPERMFALRDRIVGVTGTDAPSRPKRVVRVNPLSALSDSIPLERCAARWAPAIAEGDAASIHSALASCSVPGAFAAEDPAWAELVRVREAADSVRVSGWVWERGGAPSGLALWVNFFDHGKISLLLIPSETDPELVGNLMIRPDDMQWLGRSY